MRITDCVSLIVLIRNIRKKYPVTILLTAVVRNFLPGRCSCLLAACSGWLVGIEVRRDPGHDLCRVGPAGHRRSVGHRDLRPVLDRDRLLDEAHFEAAQSLAARAVFARR